VRGGEPHRCEFEVFAELEGGERVAEGRQRGLLLGGFKKGLFRSRLLEPTREDAEDAVRRPFGKAEDFAALSAALANRGIVASTETLFALPLEVELGGGWLEGHS
jgi:hypothetical protein